MSFITWNDQMSVKVKEIDEQHKKLIEMTNELFDSVRDGKSIETLRSILGDLVAYTQLHFKTEEDYFKQYNYPNSEEHIAEHESFKKKVEGFIVEYKEKKMGLSSEIFKFLQVWIYTHILDVDKKYSSHFNKNGLK